MSTLCGGNGGKNGFKDGEGEKALFNFPYGLLVRDGDGKQERKLIVTESDNHSMREIRVGG